MSISGEEKFCCQHSKEDEIVYTGGGPLRIIYIRRRREHLKLCLTGYTRIQTDLMVDIERATRNESQGGGLGELYYRGAATELLRQVVKYIINFS